MSKPLTIAVDFDGTCVTHEFPRVGRDVGAVPVLLDLVKSGARLILWTMRSDGRDDGGNYLTDAVNWFKEHGIPLFGVNENPEQKSWTGSPKCYAQIYIDDAAFGCPLKMGFPDERPFVDWRAVRAVLLPDEETKS
jgi:hypothetical protein